MAEIDPVTVKLIADNNRYISEMRRTAIMADRSLDQQERAVRDLENQMRKSSANISSSLKTMAGSFAAYFSAQQIVSFSDGFTRLQNSLKVAGLEGENLNQVQGKLLDMSGRYGVNINNLASLFGNATQAGKELGASQDQLLTLTGMTSQALLITGKSSAEASGAILGLEQALASGKVRAEEFNQMNEGGLRPLLQVAAASERFGGSVSKLRAAVNDGKLTSEEFFQLMLTGSAQLEAQAAKANLTLAGSFESLTSALTVYIGQSVQSSGVTSAAAAGMGLLAKNLDVLIPALATVAAFFAGRYVLGLAAAGAGAVAKTVANARLAASEHAVAVATAKSTGLMLAQAPIANQAAASVTRLAVAKQVASQAGAGLASMLGGPVNIALTALGALFAYVAVRAATLSAEQAKLRGEHADSIKTLADLDAKLRAAGAATNFLSDTIGNSANMARQAAAAYAIAAQKARELAEASGLAVIQQAQSRIVEAQDRVRNVEARDNASWVNPGQLLDRIIGPSAQEVRAEAEQTVAINRGIIERQTALMQQTWRRTATGGGNPTDATGPSGGAASGDDSKKKEGGSGPSGANGPTQAEIDARFRHELFSLTQQTLSARQQLAQSAEEEADLALRSIEQTRRNVLIDLENEKHYSASQKERLSQQVEAIAQDETEIVERQKRARLEQEASDLAQTRLAGEVDALQAQLDSADNAADRNRLALRIFDLEEAERQAVLARVAANEDLSDAIRQRAAVELQLAKDSQGGRRSNVERGNQSPAQQFMRELNRSSGAIQEDLEAIAVNGLDNLNNDIADAIMGAKSLGDAFGDMANMIIRDLIRIAIQQAIIKPMAESLFGGGGFGGGFGSIFGGGGGGLGSFFGSIFGRASGGYSAPGQLIRVNEGAGAGQAEFWRPNTGGEVIPLGQINAQAAGSSSAPQRVTVALDLSGDIDARILDTSTNVTLEINRQQRPELVKQAASATAYALRRPKM